MKVYTHELFYCVDSKKNIVELRLSFDEDNLFIRSASILKPTLSEIGKEIVMRRVPIKNIYPSCKAAEYAEPEAKNGN